MTGAAALVARAQGAGAGKTRGVPMAAISIEVFSDFQCPACKMLHEQTLRQLVVDYVDRGKVYLRHREFPLPGHAFSRPAAQLATAAAKIGRYDRVADVLFARQDYWSRDGQVEAAVATVLSADEMKKVKQLALTPEVRNEIEADMREGEAQKLSQTPTMIITHKGRNYPIAGQVNYNILRRLLDQLLGQ